VSEIYIGIDLGGTNIKIGCFDEKLNLLCKTSVITEAQMEPKVVVERINAGTRKLLADNNIPMESVKAVGIGVPGPSNVENGMIIAAPNLPLFKNVPIRDMLSEKFDKPVVFENDANVACWGEHAVGAGKGIDNMVFFTLGTGIGGGIITEGKLLHGFNNNATELGHLIVRPGGRVCGCGQKGCAEAHASASSTAARAQEAIEAGAESSLKKVLEDNKQITCKDVFEHAKSGDKFATEIVEETAKCLAILCIDLLHTTGPERIVFAGGMIAAGEQLLGRVKHYYEEYLWTLKAEKTEICFATLGEDAGIIGAAALALYETGNK
jgi:glucokinase